MGHFPIVLIFWMPLTELGRQWIKSLIMSRNKLKFRDTVSFYFQREIYFVLADSKPPYYFFM